MEFPNEDIINRIYKTGMFAECEIGDTYKELRNAYNELYETIEDVELKKKLEKLEELKNEMYSENTKDTFKLGFSVATKIFIEALKTNV